MQTFSQVFMQNRLWNQKFQKFWGFQEQSKFNCKVCNHHKSRLHAHASQIMSKLQGNLEQKGGFNFVKVASLVYLLQYSIKLPSF